MNKSAELTAAVSSTVLDLPEHRQMVFEACRQMRVVPNSWDENEAADVSNLRMNLDRVKSVDVFIGIYAHWYGFVPTLENPDRISISEMEFNVAKERNIPRLVFLIHEDHPVTQLQVETGEGAEKLERFKQRLKQERNVSWFRSPEELKSEVIAALATLIRGRTSGSNERVPSAPDPSTSAKDDDSEEGTVSFSDVRLSDFTDGAWAVIEVARRLGSNRLRPEAFSVRRLLASLMLWGLDDERAQHTGRWLVLQADREEAWVRKQIADIYHEWPNDPFSFPAILDSQASVASFMTPRLKEVFELARRLATESRANQADRRIAARHLLGAAVARAHHRTNVERFLRNLNLDMTEVRAKLIEDLPRWGVEDDPEVYRRLLDSVETPPELRGLPVYAADSASGPDLIGITREVEAMASLVSAWSVEPPLSVGLFGEWGSGKSFFMEKMRERVWQIAAEARKSKLGQREFGYYKNIVQVEFNAWHYIEGNLWASLVEHIFSNLRLTGTGELDVDGEEHIEARLDKLLSEVKDKSHEVQQRELIAAQASQEAQAKTEEAERKAKELDDAAEQARSRAETLEEERREAEEKAAQKQREADASTLERASIGLKDIFEEVSAAPGVRAALEKDLGELGITKDRLKTAQGLEEAIKEASAAGTILHEGVKILTTDRRRWLLLIWVIATPLVVVALVWAGAYLAKSQNSTWMQSITGIVSTVAAMAGAIVGFWKRYSPKLQPILNAVERVREKRAELGRQVEEIRERRAVRAAELDEVVQQKNDDAKAERQTADAKTAEAEQARQEAEEKKRDAKRAAVEAESAKVELEKKQAEAEALRPERRIAAFIQDRAQAQDYRQHLGVPALIRRDFEKLSRMFRTQRKFEKQDREIRNDLTIVNRIILYIDDLDRCPPEKVVEVLRAIHLLLAFPLFVVIVAVDARWMKRALRDRFALMLGDRSAKGKVDETSNSQSDPMPTATPDDYLEKIFQVPFWIRPLGVKACQNLVNALTKDDVESPGRDNSEAQTKKTDTPPLPKPSPSIDSGAPGGGGSTVPNQSAEPVNQTQPASKSLPVPNFEWSVIEPKPRSLQLLQDEREYMVELASLIGRSPRSVKRFVNCYRLLKSALDKDEQARVIRDGTFRSTMLLLGLVTGLPDIAPELLTHLRQSPPKLLPVEWLNRAGDALDLKQRAWWPDLLPVVERLGTITGLTSIRPLVEAAALVDRFSFSPVRTPVSVIVEKNALDPAQNL